MDRSAYDRYWQLEQTHFWRVGRRRLLLDLVERHLDPQPSRRLLDVGGACTLITQHLSRFGDVTMVEPDVPTAEFARRELGLDVRIGSLPDQMPVEGPFDVVTLFDVIEHIDDDLAAVCAARELLRPGGLLVLTVPAVPLLWSDHDVSVHHRRRYLRGTFQPLLVNAGLVIERMSYFTSLLFPLVAADRLIKRARGTRAKAEYDVKVPPAPINRALLAVMGVERRILSATDLPIGSSLVAVCRRPLSGS